MRWLTLFRRAAALTQPCLLISGRLARAAGRRFYWYLAAIVTIGLVLSPLLGLQVGTVDGRVYDSVIRGRFSSPEPSDSVVILDIDERSLAAMAPEYGRWPWSRAVLARVVAELEAAGASGILLNVLITDPDKRDPQGDGLLDSVTRDSSVVVYPMVRLPQKESSATALKVSMVPGATSTDGRDHPLTALLPAFSGMQRSMGISNALQDEDGVLRQYTLTHRDDGWSMPTLVGRLVQVAGAGASPPSDAFYLNWRNKRGDYHRISLSDYIESLDTPSPGAVLPVKGRYVVIGSSAPGIGRLFSTSSDITTDDNEILATAIDDAVHGTHLRLAPGWTMTLLAIVFVWFLAWCLWKREDKTDLIFSGLQSGGLGLMFLSASYSHYFLDLSPMIAAGTFYFSVARMHQYLDQRAVTGAPEHFKEIQRQSPDLLAIASVPDSKGAPVTLDNIVEGLQKSFGNAMVLRVDQAFSSGRISGELNETAAVVVVSKGREAAELLGTLTTCLRKLGLSEVPASIVKLSSAAISDSVALRHFASEEVILHLARQVEAQRAANVDGRTSSPDLNG